MGKQCEWRRLTYWSTVNAIKVGMALPRVLEPLERHRGHRTRAGLAYIHVYAYTNTNFFVYVYGIRVCIGVFGCM